MQPINVRMGMPHDLTQAKPLAVPARKGSAGRNERGYARLKYASL